MPRGATPRQSDRNSWDSGHAIDREEPPTGSSRNGAIIFRTSTEMRPLKILVAMLSVVGISAASPELTKGKTLHATCVACHQADGRGNMAMKAPGIRGQESWYLETQ